MPGHINKADVDSFVKVFYSACEKYGLKKVTDTLNNLLAGSDDNIRERVRIKILDEISFIYGIKPSQILKSRTRGLTTQARVLAIVMFHRHLQFKGYEIASMFNNDKGNISQIITIFSKKLGGTNINPSQSVYVKTFNDNFFSNFSKVDSIIKTYIAELQTPKK
jgi:predicted Zn-dependent protease with MMP-like domain